MDKLLGAAKSWTVWLGGSILTLPDWWPLISDQVTGLIGEGAGDKLLRLMGILVVLVRFKTTQSLADKGGTNA